MNKKVSVVIVTYNRKDYLMNLLQSIENQTYNISKVIIVDNNSTDGTAELLLKNGYIKDIIVDSQVRNDKCGTEYIYYKNSYNSGGSGGFKKAFEIVSKEDCDYVWAMDDDVYAESNCLENLISCMTDDVHVCIPNRNCQGFVDEAIIDFNWNNPFKSIQCKKTKKVDNTNIMVKDFPFEGPLFKKEIINLVGLPNSDYFILFDDSDYAQRCLKYSKIYYIASAKLKKQIIPNNGNVKFSWKIYYSFRNEITFDRLYNKNKFVSLIRPHILLAKRVIRFTINGNKVARKYSFIAYKDALNGNYGKTVEPGSI